MSGLPDDPRDGPAAPPLEPGAIVDWAIIGRRLRLSAVALLGLAVAAWVVAGLAHGAVRVVDLWGYVGLAFVGMFIAELVFVGGSAVRGMLRVGARGERLAGSDVGLLPTQVLRRSERDRTDEAGS